MALVAELQQIRSEIEAASTQAIGLCKGLNEADLAWRERPNRWSIAENLVHLCTTTQVFLPSADQTIEEARRRKLFSQGPFQLNVMGRFYVWYVEPPPVIRLPDAKGFASLAPRPGHGSPAKVSGIAAVDD